MMSLEHRYHSQNYKTTTNRKPDIHINPTEPELQLPKDQGQEEMALNDSYEATVADIERMKALLEQMEDKLDEMEKVLAEMPIEDTEAHQKTRLERQRSIDEKLDWISSKYDEIIAKELELQKVYE